MSTTPIHIMLDLETWGTTPGSDLRSIGAVVFDPVAGTLGDEFYVNVENPHVAGIDVKQNGYFFDDTSGVWRKYPLARDPKTVQWWSEQSVEAQAVLTKDVRDLKDGLYAFGAWLSEVNGEASNLSDTPLRIWAHGPTFDCTLAAAAYTAVGLPLPWHYRAPRDTRTIFEAAGGVEIPTNGTYHNALDDAKNQALAVIEAYRKLGLGKQPGLFFPITPGVTMRPGDMVCTGSDGKLRHARPGDLNIFPLHSHAKIVGDQVEWPL